MSASDLRDAAALMRADLDLDASWHFAVADWLDEVFMEADLFGEWHPEPRCECSAHTVARAYLGDQP